MREILADPPRRVNFIETESQMAADDQNSVAPVLSQPPPVDEIVMEKGPAARNRVT
jgi:hypothetical protein